VKMPPLPPRFILFAKTRPSKCVVLHTAAPPGWPKMDSDSVVVLSFSRPALAKSYAFIQEYEECPGLCGTTFLRVFQKHGGRWAQVGRVILSVS
jgi:hypothetical protein